MQEEKCTAEGGWVGGVGGVVSYLSATTRWNLQIGEREKSVRKEAKTEELRAAREATREDKHISASEHANTPPSLCRTQKEEREKRRKKQKQSLRYEDEGLQTPGKALCL